MFSLKRTQLLTLFPFFCEKTFHKSITALLANVHEYSFGDVPQQCSCASLVFFTLIIIIFVEHPGVRWQGCWGAELTIPGMLPSCSPPQNDLRCVKAHVSRHLLKTACGMAVGKLMCTQSRGDLGKTLILIQQVKDDARDSTFLLMAETMPLPLVFGL